MKAFVIGNKEILNILHRSSETRELQTLLKDLLPVIGCTATEYMYNILSMYLMHYTPINDTSLNIEQHNRVYNRFEEAAKLLDHCDGDIRSVNHVEALLGSGSVETYGNFNSTIYDDLYQYLSDHHVQLYGNRGVERMQDEMVEQLDAVVELTMYTAKEIESRYLSFHEDERNSNVLFGLKNNQLMVFVD
jgi:hypothetical protein